MNKRTRGPGVYMIMCLPNKRRYIGSSWKDWLGRRSGHMALLKAGRHHSKDMQADWNRLGPDAFRMILICECPPEFAESIEGAAINALHGLRSSGGYNYHAVDSGLIAGFPVSGPKTVRFSAWFNPYAARRIAESFYVPNGMEVGVEQASVKGLRKGGLLSGFNYNHDTDLGARLDFPFISFKLTECWPRLPECLKPENPDFVKTERRSPLPSMLNASPWLKSEYERLRRELGEVSRKLDACQIAT